MSETLTHLDGETYAEVKAQRDALLGCLIDLGVQADAGRYGRSDKTLRATERAVLEQQHAAHWWSRVTADTDEAERWRAIADRQTRGDQ